MLAARSSGAVGTFADHAGLVSDALAERASSARCRRRLAGGRESVTIVQPGPSEAKKSETERPVLLTTRPCVSMSPMAGVSDHCEAAVSGGDVGWVVQGRGTKGPAWCTSANPLTTLEEQLRVDGRLSGVEHVGVFHQGASVIVVVSTDADGPGLDEQDAALALAEAVADGLARHGVLSRDGITITEAVYHADDGRPDGLLSRGANRP